MEAPRVDCSVPHFLPRFQLSLPVYPPFDIAYDIVIITEQSDTTADGLL